MPRFLNTRAWTLAVGVALFLTALQLRSVTMAKDEEAKPMIVHDVYFSLNESNPATRKTLVDACKKYLTDHAGVVYFSAGTVSDKLTREVNDRDWDVGLHIVFKTLADHDTYQTHPRHEQFIAENKSTWKKVRVFDTEAN